MSRIPGTPEEKLALLSRIDQKTLPHLAGDILFFVHKHKDIKVVDGPGDGKRDVYSVKPDEKRHITQCKYHHDTSASVSSDETDELILALNKFGCKSGLFVTTGKISPQAKREYLDNYPEFQLDFLDGIGLVETILSSPILSAVWFNGTSIIQVRNALSIPFILRRIKDDHPILTDELPDKSYGDIDHKYQKDACETVDFEPYRPPIDKTFSEHGAKFIQGFRVICSGKIHAYDIPQHLDFITKNIAQSTKIENFPLIVRFGQPAVISHAENVDGDTVKITLPEAQSFSYVITRKKTIIPEKEWIVFQSKDNWDFPENFSVTQAEWAGWINPASNTVFMQELSWRDSQETFFHQQLRRLTQRYLEESLFISGDRAYAQSVFENIADEDKPNWQCDFGPNGILLGWLHPALDAIKNGVVFSRNPEDDTFTGKVTAEVDVDSFEKLKLQIMELSRANNLKEVSIEQALLISSISGNSLLTEKKSSEMYSAELYHFYNDVPSPVFTAERKFIFVRMWKVEETPQEAREILDSKPITLSSSNNAKTFWDARYGPATKKTYLMSSLIFTPPAEISSNEFFEQIEQDRESCFAQLAAHIQSLLRAELATLEFWQTELDFHIKEGRTR